ncbi:MAG: anti-sigma factor family protein [Ignavibacteriales bacterium]
MYCENKNYLLDLYFLEGNENEHPEIREHVAGCESCREYLAALKGTMDMLSILPEEKPADDLFGKILSEVSTSVPKQKKVKKGVELVPILQIAFGEIFLFLLMYFIKVQLTLMPFWNTVEKSWIVQSLGSVGVSAVIILLAGSFITLAMAPILLLESEKQNSFN